MSNEMQKIGFQSTRFRTVQGVMHYVNEQTLTRAHQKQSSKKAVGVDGINKADFDKDAAQQVKLLTEQMLRHQYRVQPVRRVYIPKTGGKLRPLGIPAYRDRLVQSVMADIPARNTNRTRLWKRTSWIRYWPQDRWLPLPRTASRSVSTSCSPRKH